MKQKSQEWMKRQKHPKNVVPKECVMMRKKKMKMRKVRMTRMQRKQERAMTRKST